MKPGKPCLLLQGVEPAAHGGIAERGVQQPGDDGGGVLRLEVCGQLLGLQRGAERRDEEPVERLCPGPPYASPSLFSST